MYFFELQTTTCLVRTIKGPRQIRNFSQRSRVTDRTRRNSNFIILSRLILFCFVSCNVASHNGCYRWNEQLDIKLHETFCRAHSIINSIHIFFEVFSSTFFSISRCLIIHFPDTPALLIVNVFHFFFYPLRLVVLKIPFLLYLIYSQPYLEFTFNTIMRNKASLRCPRLESNVYWWWLWWKSWNFKVLKVSF